MTTGVKIYRAVTGLAPFLLGAGYGLIFDELTAKGRIGLALIIVGIVLVGHREMIDRRYGKR